MDWGLIGAIFGAVSGGWGEYQRRKRRAAELRAKKDREDLERIRAEASRMRAREQLAEQAAAARARGRK